MNYYNDKNAQFILLSILLYYYVTFAGLRIHHFRWAQQIVNQLYYYIVLAARVHADRDRNVYSVDYSIYDYIDMRWNWLKLGCKL